MNRFSIRRKRSIAGYTLGSPRKRCSFGHQGQKNFLQAKAFPIWDIATACKKFFWPWWPKEHLFLGEPSVYPAILLFRRMLNLFMRTCYGRRDNKFSSPVNDNTDALTLVTPTQLKCEIMHYQRFTHTPNLSFMR